MSHHVAYADWDGPPADEPLPWVRPGFGWTELVASWEAETPPGSWIEVAARAEAADGSRSELAAARPVDQRPGRPGPTQLGAGAA